MNQEQQNKAKLREFVRVVWEGRNLSQLPTYWTPDCVNHAAPTSSQVGLDALRVYHEGFFSGFLPAFTDARIDYVQQIAEEDRVVTQMIFSGLHTRELFGKPPTHKVVSLASIRIDRFEDGKIAEHWSVGDVAGLMQQIEQPAR
jgi:predicted ester cyclase